MTRAAVSAHCSTGISVCLYVILWNGSLSSAYGEAVSAKTFVEQAEANKNNKRFKRPILFFVFLDVHAGRQGDRHKVPRPQHLLRTATGGLRKASAFLH